MNETPHPAWGSRWFTLLVGVSAVLVAVTMVSYALAGNGALSRALFWIGLGGERNVGSWWSGMLFLLAGLFALDGYLDAAKSTRERRGWAALGAALLLLSFDEVAALHEYLGRLGVVYLVPLGVLGAALTTYALLALRGAGVRIGSLIAAFALLASVPAQEYVQLTREWTNPVLYGVRALIEEGTEVAAALIFVAVTHACTAALRASSGELLAAPVRLRGAVLWSSCFALPAATAAAVFMQPNPTGPASWLTAALFLLCALLAARSIALGRDGGAARTRLLYYLAASLAANAISTGWDPEVLGRAVSLRGVTFAALLAVGAAIAHRPDRGFRRLLSALAVFTLGAALLWPRSTLLWSAWLAALAVLCYRFESTRAALASAAWPNDMGNVAPSPREPSSGAAA